MPTFNAGSADIQNRLRADAAVPDDVIFTMPMLAGGLLGAAFASGSVRKFALSYLPNLRRPLMWMLVYGGGFVFGTLVAFLLIYVPTVFGVTLRRRMRPGRFSRPSR